MSSQGEYYDVQKFGDEWVAMYDPEQALMGQRFKTEAEAWAFVQADKATPLPEQGGFNERLTEMLTKLHEAHYDTIDGTDGCKSSIDEAKADIRTLILEEIIGEDEEPDIPPTRHPNSKPGYSLRATVINKKLAEQRKKLGGTHGTK